jgi:hypothetical protein
MLNKCNKGGEIEQSLGILKGEGTKPRSIIHMEVIAMNEKRLIDLTEYYGCGEAAEVLTRNSNHTIRPGYVRTLVVYGLLSPVKVNGRCLYPKEQIDNYVVRERSHKARDVVA